MRQDILKEVCYCPAEKAVLLASLGAQVKHGNYEVEHHQEGYLANDKILPQSVINGHKLSREEISSLLIGLAQCCALIGRELHSGEIFSSTERS